MIASGEVSTVCLKVSGKTAKSLLKRGDIDAPHELVPLINIENQNALTGPVIALSCIGRADVQIPLGRRLFSRALMKARQMSIARSAGRPFTLRSKPSTSGNRNGTILSSTLAIEINGLSDLTSRYFSRPPPPLMPVNNSVMEVRPITRRPSGRSSTLS